MWEGNMFARTSSLAATLGTTWPFLVNWLVKGGGMLGSVVTVPRSLEDYRAIVGDEVVEGLHQKAHPLRGARVIHINATAFGGGVAEILGALVPLMNDLGLRAEWQVVQG